MPPKINCNKKTDMRLTTAIIGGKLGAFGILVYGLVKTVLFAR